MKITEKIKRQFIATKFQRDVLPILDLTKEEKANLTEKICHISKMSKA